MNAVRISLALLTLLGLAACSSSSGNGAPGASDRHGATADGGALAICGTTPGGSCVDSLGCTESIGTASDIATLQAGCTKGGGTWSTGLCETSPYVGGCCESVGVTSAQTYWVIAGNSTAAEEQSQCYGMGGEWFTP